MDLEGLSEIVSGYEYGQHNILEDGVAVSYDFERRKIRFDSFYSNNLSGKKGVCRELMNFAKFDITMEYPEYHVYRVCGNEPVYFSDKETSSHCFLFVSEERLIEGVCRINNPWDIHNITSKNPVIVDPSFGKAASFLGSEYNVKSITTSGFGLSHSDIAILENKRSVPLYINSNKDLVSVGANFDFSNPLCIAVQSPGELGRSYEFGNEELRERLDGDSEISKFVDLFDRCEKTEGSFNFRLGREIVVA